MLALAATLLLAFQGALAAAIGFGAPAERPALTASQTEPTLCVADLGHGGGHRQDAHCPSDCCMAGRGPAAAPPPQEPTLLLPVVARGAVSATPRAPPAPASGWASSWSSRAPPAR
jgi:hypothetical protein